MLARVYCKHMLRGWRRLFSKWRRAWRLFSIGPCSFTAAARSSEFVQDQREDGVRQLRRVIPKSSKVVNLVTTLMPTLGP